MNRIVLTAEQSALIDGGRVEIIDADGKKVGDLFTEAAYHRFMATLFPEPTREEIAEARREMLEHGGVPGEELLASLKKARQEWEARG